MLIVVRQGAIVEFDTGDFIEIGKDGSGSSLLFDHSSVFRDTAYNRELAERTIAKGNFRLFVESMEDVFACIALDKAVPKWILTDQFGGRRLYYFQSDSILAISDNALGLVKWLIRSGVSISIDRKQLNRFIRIGYSDEGKTFLNNFGRSIAGMQIRFDSRKTEDLLRYMEPLNTRFDEVIESTMYRATRRAGGIALLFSGGMDSTALLIACMEAAPDRDIVCITAFPEQEALADVRVKAQIETSAKLTKKLGVRHEYVKMNFINKEEQVEIARAQPFDFGISNWLPGFRAVPKESNYLFLCGQNADSLSNFGHTAPFLWTGRPNKTTLMGKRLLVTRQFIESPYKWLLSPILEKMFVRSGKYKLARTDQEVFDFFFQPDMYRLPLARKSDVQEPSHIFPESHTSLMEELFLKNLRRYNDSSLSRLFQTAAALSGQNALLPYSTRDMINFFYQRLHTVSALEQLRGKYQIRKYVTKRIPKSLLMAGYAIEDVSNRRKIRMKSDIRREARHVWASVLPPPLDDSVFQGLEEFEADEQKNPAN